jgi:uncharacterized DUF497 family protein
LEISFDPAKEARNQKERGLSFTLVADLDWENALAVEDTRRDYGERRIQVLAMLGPRLHMAVVTFRGETLHVISLRKANQKEVTRYDRHRT